MPYHGARKGIRAMVVYAAIVSTVSLVLGPILTLQVYDTAEDNKGLICGLGELLNSGPAQQQPGQSDKEFERGVAALRHFADQLNTLTDCSVKVTIRAPALDKKQGGDRANGPPGPSG
jgi:hypothetical protein